MKKSKSLLLILLLFVGLIQAQNKLTGKVTNSDHKPIANARIYLDSIYSNTKTNKKGEFEVLITNPIRFINVYSTEYGLLTSAYTNETVMNFMFLETDKMKKTKTEEADNITIGYSKETNNYQILTKKSINVEKDKNTSSYNTIYDLIRGRLPGVNVSSNNVITIRGVNSIRYIVEPLFVVDGLIVSSIEFLSPNMVKNINVLKGSEASMYGAQGTGGAIVITTKK